MEAVKRNSPSKHHQRWLTLLGQAANKPRGSRASGAARASSHLLPGARIQGRLDLQAGLAASAILTLQRLLGAAQHRRPGQDHALGSRDQRSLPSSASVVAPQKGPGEICSSTNITPWPNTPQSLWLWQAPPWGTSAKKQRLHPQPRHWRGARLAARTATARSGAKADTSGTGRPAVATPLKTNRKTQLKASPGKYQL